MLPPSRARVANQLRMILSSMSLLAVAWGRREAGMGRRAEDKLPGGGPEQYIRNGRLRPQRAPPACVGVRKRLLRVQGGGQPPV